MLKFGKSFSHILWHGNINIAFFVVPGKRETKVARARKIFCENIFSFKGIEEVVEISRIIVLYAKVIDGKGEGGAACGMLPQSRSETNWSIAIGGKMGAELIVGQNAGFFKTIHAFAYFKIGITLGVEVLRSEVVFINDGLGNIAAMDAHVLEGGHV